MRGGFGLSAILGVLAWGKAPLEDVSGPRVKVRSLLNGSTSMAAGSTLAFTTTAGGSTPASTTIAAGSTLALSTVAVTTPAFTTATVPTPVLTTTPAPSSTVSTTNPPATTGPGPSITASPTKFPTWDTSCAGFQCPDSSSLRREAHAITCLAAGCDVGQCCFTPPLTCSGFSCPASMHNRPEPGDISCLADPCETKQCCLSNSVSVPPTTSQGTNSAIPATCGGFSCPDELLARGSPLENVCPLSGCTPDWCCATHCGNFDCPLFVSRVAHASTIKCPPEGCTDSQCCAESSSSTSQTPATPTPSPASTSPSPDVPKGVNALLGGLYSAERSASVRKAVEPVGPGSSYVMALAIISSFAMIAFVAGIYRRHRSSSTSVADLERPMHVESEAWIASESESGPLD